MRENCPSKRRRNGHSVMEVALMAPWIFFLFVGILDAGFYSYAAICTQNAARAAALQTAAGVGAQSDTIACLAALSELKFLPNVKALSLTTCGANAAAITAAAPVAVQRKTLCATATVIPTTLTCDAPGCADCTQDNKAASSQVAVTYQTDKMVNVPGIITNQLTLTRVVEARIIAE